MVTRVRSARQGLRELWLALPGLLALLPALPVSNALACKCKHAGPFLSVVPQTSLVVAGKVVAHQDYSMDVAVQRVLAGSAPAQIRVQGDTGKACRPYVTQFPVGTSWVFALTIADEPSQPAAAGSAPAGSTPAGSAPAGPEYQLSICGSYWLRVDGSTAHGDIGPGPSGRAAQDSDGSSTSKPGQAAPQQASGQTLSISQLQERVKERMTPVAVHKVAQLNSLEGRRILLSGPAQNAKAGAVLMIGEVPVYIDGQDAWPDGQRGQTLRMTGILVVRKHIADPVDEHGMIAQGAWGKQYVLTHPAPAP